MTTSRAQTLILSMMIVALAMETNMVTRLVNLTKLAINGSGTGTTTTPPPGSMKPGPNNSCQPGYSYQASSNSCVPLIASNSTPSGSVSTPPIQNYNPGGLPTVSL